MSGSRTTFGPRLRAERERRGITLDTVAESTKIKASLLAGLERGDVSRWPAGIFRRAYVRNYAHAIGLDPAPIVAEFLHLFPEQGVAAVETATSPATAPPLRLTLAIEPRDQLQHTVSGLLAVGLELGAILLAGVVVALAGGLSFWSASGLVALVYYPVATALLGPARQPRELPATVRRLARALQARGQEARRKRLYVIPSTEPRSEAAHATADVEFPRRRTAAS